MYLMTLSKEVFGVYICLSSETDSFHLFTLWYLVSLHIMQFLTYIMLISVLIKSFIVIYLYGLFVDFHLCIFMWELHLLSCAAFSIFRINVLTVVIIIVDFSSFKAVV